ncbi:MAG: 2Fe-2S iron-sulfur cluster-binding protein, partial [Wenzhouxiangellaceae bacterium]|nr:2Fe-2S iron-sulfur cluster-binding protein [Wenzhouxiangellaceae bacterium]
MYKRSAHRIGIQPSGKQIEARAGETVLAAALRQGVILPYSCKNGTCASCKCRLREGEVHYPFTPPTALEPADLAEGNILACQAVAEDDISIDAREIEQVADIPGALLPARVDSIDEL